MIYGEKKVKNMKRSILPSTHRKRARREKSKIQRLFRRNVRQALQGDFDEASDKILSETKRFRDDQRELIWERRSGDKISHFVRWCRVKSTEEDNIQEKYSKVKSVMGGCKDVISYHALTHFIDPRDFNLEETQYFRASYESPDSEFCIPKVLLGEKLESIQKNPEKLKELNDLLCSDKTFAKKKNVVCNSDEACVKLTRVQTIEDLYLGWYRLGVERSHISSKCKNYWQFPRDNISDFLIQFFPKGKKAYGYTKEYSPASFWRRDKIFKELVYRIFLI